MSPRYLKTGSAKSNKAAAPAVDVAGVVKEVITSIRNEGDPAVRRYSEKFDKWSPESFKLSQQQIQDIIASVDKQIITDIHKVQASVRKFAEAQRASFHDFEIEMEPGVMLGQKSNPIEKVGTYIPGGRYPLLASAHMTILTAKVAGCKHIIACTPPINGKIPNATVAAMHYAGADDIHILGGVQAVAAMACGTESIPKVAFLAGPGNAFVAEAKKQLYGEVGIDLLAGPTEILIVADEHADPYVVATDLLSQAEHGPDTPAVLITNSEKVAQQSMAYVDELLPNLETKALAGESWRSYGEVAVVSNMDEAYALADEYSSEHVQILTQDPRQALEKMTNYGAIFLGEGTCVSYGDKCIGTNHVLPTKKNSRHTGGLWVGKYLRTVTYQEVTSQKASAELGRLCGRAARAEFFEGHARSGDLRAHKYDGDSYGWIDPSHVAPSQANTNGHANGNVNGAVHKY